MLICRASLQQLRAKITCVPYEQASLFGKLGIFAFAAWAGAQGGGVIAGLAVCGVFLAVTSAAAGAPIVLSVGMGSACPIAGRHREACGCCGGICDS